VTEPLATRLRRIQRQIAAFHDLHADELQLIIDELHDLAAELEPKPSDVADPPAASEPASAPTSSLDADPAAASPKRAKWLAERERRAHLTRRDLLRGRGDPSS
jgi:hypothetical protein